MEQQPPPPLTPLGSKTHLSHPALTKIVIGLAVIILAASYLVFASYTGRWPYAQTPQTTPTPSSSPQAGSKYDDWSTYTEETDPEQKKFGNDPACADVNVMGDGEFMAYELQAEQGPVFKLTVSDSITLYYTPNYRNWDTARLWSFGSDERRICSAGWPSPVVALSDKIVWGQLNCSTGVDSPEVRDCLALAAKIREHFSVVYDNKSYGLRVLLPQDWQGFRIQTAAWAGDRYDDQGTQTVVATGPELHIIHPLSTDAAPRQDIPIMVFTLEQWAAQDRGEWHIGAAPIGPSELARNSHYVFALPARYNFAFSTGYQEVDQIVSGGSVQAYEP